MKYIKCLALALAIFTTSCKEAEKPVTKEQAQELANAIVKSVIKRDKSILDASFDIDMLTDRIKASSPEKPANYWEGLKNGIANKIDFGNKILTALGKKGRYDLLKQYEKDGKQHLVFRLFADYSINYHDFELASKKGKIKIADVYIYMSGEYFSTTLNNLFTEIMDMEKGESMPQMEQLKKLTMLMNTGKNEAAKELIDELPVNLRSVKSIQFYNIRACSQINDSLYNDAIEKFGRDFPGDPSLDLVLVDGYFLKKKYPEALACVERLDKRINTDPMLDYYRALLYNLQGKRVEAMQTLEQLHKNLPDFSPGSMELSTYYMDKNEYEKAADIVNKAKQNRDYDEATVQNLYMLYPKLKQYLKD